MGSACCSAAYLSVIMPLTIIALVLPNFTTSTFDGSLSPLQTGFLSLFTLALYGIFLALQTGRHRGHFMDPAETVEATAPEGAVHLTLFAVFLVLIFSP